MTGVALGERGVGGSVDSETVHLAAPRSSGRTVVVVGQGIDGLTIAMRVARAGYSVVGIDRENDRVRSLAQGRSPIAGVTDDALSAALRSGRYVPTTDYAKAAGFGTAIITVPARHSTEHENVEYLRSAAGSLAPHLQRGTAVVVEGVAHPSVVRQVVLPLLEAGSGLRAGRDFTFGIAGSGLLGGAAMAAGRADIVAVGPRSATAIGDFLRSLAFPEAGRRPPSPDPRTPR